MVRRIKKAASLVHHFFKHFTCGKHVAKSNMLRLYRNTIYQVLIGKIS